MRFLHYYCSILDDVGPALRAALEKSIYDVCSRQDYDQQQSTATQLSQECHDLFQLFVENESQEDIHRGVKDRAENIHQEKAQRTYLQSAGAQGHEVAEREEFCSRE
jgi:hypothetical protein